MTQIARNGGWGRGACSLRHYDAVHTNCIYVFALWASVSGLISSVRLDGMVGRKLNRYNMLVRFFMQSLKLSSLSLCRVIIEHKTNTHTQEKLVTVQ